MKNVKCRNCAKLKNGWCDDILDSPYPDDDRDCEYFRQKTNADRIRAMTDEELAELICHRVICRACIAYDKCHLRNTQTECKQFWLDWLQSPVDGEADADMREVSDDA